MEVMPSVLGLERLLEERNIQSPIAHVLRSIQLHYPIAQIVQTFEPLEFQSHEMLLPNRSGFLNEFEFLEQVNGRRYNFSIIEHQRIHYVQKGSP